MKAGPFQSLPLPAMAVWIDQTLSLCYNDGKLLAKELNRILGKKGWKDMKAS